MITDQDEQPCISSKIYANLSDNRQFDRHVVPFIVEALLWYGSPSTHINLRVAIMLSPSYERWQCFTSYPL
uniref:Uncharacterized protein n=1 Tax=Oryza brachyantha TaxID=4533 RepID=J3M4H5_ORYBR